MYVVTSGLFILLIYIYFYANIILFNPTILNQHLIILSLPGILTRSPADTHDICPKLLKELCSQRQPSP